MIPNKIAICGSHSCGKTTLLNKLKEMTIFNTYPIIHEIAALYPPSTRLQMSTQYKIMQHQAIAEKSYTKNYGRFLSDRSIIDNIAYCTLVNKSYKRDDDIYKKCFALSEFHLTNPFRPYDLLIFIDEILPYKNSPHRNFDDFKSQEFIYTFIKNKLPELNIPYVMIKGNTSDRIDNILEFLKKLQESQ